MWITILYAQNLYNNVQLYFNKRKKKNKITQIKIYKKVASICVDGIILCRDIICMTIQFCRSVVFDSLRPHGLTANARPPCPSPTPEVYSNSCPLSQWCHPTISSSVVPFSTRLQSFPALGSFPMSQFFTSGGQSIGVSVSTSLLPMNIQDWFP